MVFNNDFKIEGNFKFEVYDKDDNLLNTYSDHNFITNSGIAYLQYLALADCFRYISLGTGTNQNSIQLGSATTGLYSGVSGFQYIGPYRFSPNTPSSTTSNGYLQNACGFSETCSGIILSKGWVIPTGDIYFNENYTFNEFMLSPSSPIGYNNSCNNVEYDDFVTLYGQNICNFIYAFTRITGIIPVNSGSYLVAYYSLNVSVNTGLNYFNITIENDGIGPQPDNPNNWIGNLKGYYNLVHQGLKLVNPATKLNFGNIYQPLNSSCDSYNGILGSPMEPSTQDTYLVSYITNDGFQFIVSPSTGGPMTTGLYFPYNSYGLPFPSGVESFHCSPNSNYFLNPNVPPWLVNTRQGISENNYPDLNNYTQPMNTYNYLSEINSFLFAGYGDETISNSWSYSSNLRTGTKQISAPFPRNIMNGQYVLGTVFGYTGNNNGNVYPFLDSIFADLGGQFSSFNTGNFNWSQPSLTDYNQMDDNNQNTNSLTIYYNLNWTAPCPSDVLGC